MLTHRLLPLLLAGLLVNLLARSSATAAARVWLTGPEAVGAVRQYELMLSDYTGVLAVEADLLIPGQAGLAQVQPPAGESGFLAASNAIADTLKLVLARAQEMAYTGMLVQIELPLAQPEPELGLLHVALNGGDLAVDYDAVTPDTTVTGATEFTFTLVSGWNLISLPVVPQDGALQSLFPGAISAFNFVPGSGYGQVEELEPGVGYWLNVPTGGDVVVAGTEAVTRCQLQLGARWSLIGVPQDAPLVADVVQDPVDNILSVFGFDGGYQLAAQLVAGQGYWVNLTTAGTLDIGSQAP